MSHKLITKRILMAAVTGLECSLLAACTGDSTGVPGVPDDYVEESSFRFEYSGSAIGSGGFNASGEVDLDADTLPSGSFVLAATDSSGAMVILGLQGNVSERYNVILMILADGRVPTTVQLDSTCIASGNCQAAAVVGLGLVEGAEDILSCALFNGTMTLTAVSSERVRGTLSRSDGACTSGTTQDQSDLTMANGRFDVALVRVDEVDDLPGIVSQSPWLAERFGRIRLRR